MSSGNKQAHVDLGVLGLFYLGGASVWRKDELGNRASARSYPSNPFPAVASSLTRCQCGPSLFTVWIACASSELEPHLDDLERSLLGRPDAIVRDGR